MLSALCGGTAVMAWELDRVGRHEQEFTCPVCGEAVVSRCGEEMPWHFAHKPGSDCEMVVESGARLTAESRSHLAAKYRLAQMFTSAGYSVTVEEPLGDMRRPDLTVVSPDSGRWCTVEVQASPIRLDEMHFRWQHDLEAGAVDVLWVWAERFNLTEGFNVTLPDDMLHYYRTTRCSLSLFRHGRLYVATDQPTWWLCESCWKECEGGGLRSTRNPACPGCGALRPASFDDAMRSYDLIPASGRIVVCKGRRGPVARLQAAEGETVHDDVAALL